MNYTLSLVILCCISLVSSLLITRILITVMGKLQIVDMPDKRRVHNKVTPRGGGLSLFITLSVFFPIFEYYIFGNIENFINIWPIFLPIALVSFWDDISHAIIPIRLLVHALSAILAVMWLIHPDRILHFEISQNLDLVIGAFALLTFLNIYNFLDGIDGITTAESIHLALTILILCIVKHDIISDVNFIILIATIILGWSIGFMYFNWQPAKIFLGDIGSISLGFLLGVCLLKVATASDRLFAACVIASLYYIADGSLTILIRIIKGEKIWQPHLQHFFQKAVQRGLSHKQVVIKIMKCNFLLMIMTISSLYYPIISIILAGFVVIVTLIRLAVA